MIDFVISALVGGLTAGIVAYSASYATVLSLYYVRDYVRGSTLTFIPMQVRTDEYKFENTHHQN